MPVPGDAMFGFAPTARLAPWVAAYPWIPYVLPLAVFLLVGSFEPPNPASGSTGSLAGVLPGLEYRFYPVVLLAKLVLTSLSVWLVRPVYRQFPLRVTWWTIPFGVVGAGVWIGICRLHWEPQLLSSIGLDTLLDVGSRSGFNPFAELPGSPLLATGVLLIRFLVLAALVPLIEEFFLRGFVVRFVVHPNWWSVPIGELNGWAWLAATAVPVLMHPQEFLAATVWFTGMTWLLVRTAQPLGLRDRARGDQPAAGYLRRDVRKLGVALTV